MTKKLPYLAASDLVEDQSDDVFPDDRLRLVFTCCHPALAPESRAALTLRMVCGLTTMQIAHAFLVSETTMAARVTRAKKKIAANAIPYRVPDQHDLPPRRDDVLSVVHLVYTTGHTNPDGGPMVDRELADRALDLAKVLASLLPTDSEVLGLLALLELTDCRRNARFDDMGEIVLLEDQDRSAWDRDQLEHGLRMLDRAMHQLPAQQPAQQPAGRFVLQAALAAVHAEANSWADTDWASAVLLYDQLVLAWPNPVVALNRAVAMSYAMSPVAALGALDRLADEASLNRYHYYFAVRADLHERAGDRARAVSDYEQAIIWCPSPTERRHLQRKLSQAQS